MNPALQFDGSNFLHRTIQMSERATPVAYLIEQIVVADCAEVSRSIVPYKTGHLHDTIEHGRDEIGAYVLAWADYSWKVHEDLNAKHAPGKQAGFIREPLQAVAPRELVYVTSQLALREIGR